MAPLGEHDIETHPRMGRRLLVAAGLALGLFVLGLIAEAHAAAPAGSQSATAMTHSPPESSWSSSPR